MALLLSLFVVVFIAALTVALLSTTVSQNKAVEAQRKDMTSFYVAEAGIDRAMANLASGGNGVIGSQASPQSLSSGTYWVTTVDNGDDTFTMVSNATYNGSRNAVEAVLRRSGGGIYHNAIFAGNSGGDPAYEMKFGGTGGQADDINGDIYSGENILFGGDATLDGTARAAGAITGIAGETGVVESIPDIAAMNYPVNHDVNVAAEFAANGTWTNAHIGTCGGSAYEVPQANLAHIFRKNPDDANRGIGTTVKDDYYLEDPYNMWASSADQTDQDAGETGAHAARIVVDPAGNNKVYYIDGNLWMHSPNKTFSYKLKTQSGGTRITLVVKGNITMSDNFFYDSLANDGIALVALKDPAVADSGNIYFGDASYGTLKRMDSFMYAENNFYDNNLEPASLVTLNGNMTAGNQVAINRDYTRTTYDWVTRKWVTTTGHTKLAVNFDDRIRAGTLTLPGLPGAATGPSGGYAIMSWREVKPTP
ncbi:MAG: hypothetical protein V1809_07270 [Planctomycetota bacterium]